MPAKAQDDDLVMNLVDLALARPREEREGFLQEACSGDADLFGKAWSYVEWEDRMQGFLKEPLFQPPSREHPFEEGAVVDGRFRIVREIARGGMGVVYEAWDEKLERRLAIKCAKAGFHKRLSPEVRLASEISHPNVCRIFEIHTAQTASGEVDFVTMEYLAGETLAERIERGPLAEAEALAIARQLCAGLGAAHSQGVIHGDLKSSNVILTKSADGSTRAAITDFGMARTRESSQATAQTGPRGGTPGYMAPELLKGEKATLASDIYALGVLLRELTTGSRKASALPAKWSPVLTRCLADAPSERYQSGVEVARAFEPSPTPRRVLVGAAAALVAIITGVVTYQRATAPRDVVRLAMLPFTYSAELSPAAERVSRETSANLAKLTGGARTRYSAVSLAEMNRASATTLDKARAKLGATHVLHGTLTKEKDRIELHALLTDTRTGVSVKDWKMDYAAGQARYIPVALTGMITGALHLAPLAISSINSAAQADYDAGTAFLKRDSTIDPALSSFARAAELDPDSALAWAGLAEARWLKWGLTHNSDSFAGATESSRQAERRNPDLPRVLYVVGTTDFVNSRYELAAAEYQRALELDPDYSDVYRFLGRVYELSGQREKALDSYRKAVQTDSGNYRTYYFLGWFFNNSDQYSQALEPLRQAVALAPAEPGARDQLGFAYKSLGQFQTAESVLRTALRFGETVLVLDELGETLMYQRREDDAISFFGRALAINPNDRFALMDLGICYRRLDRQQEADRANRRGKQAAEAAKLLNPRLGIARAYLAYFDSQLAQLEGDGAKDAEEAESEISQAVTLSPDGVEVRWIAALTYEALGQRDATLSLLSSAPHDLLALLNRWPELAGLGRDPRFSQLLISNAGQ